MDVRSVTAGGRDRAGAIARQVFPAFAALYPTKMYWFLTHGYQPHAFQGAFHAATDPSKGGLVRFRHLVAGRRGGKTKGAAWEVIFYCIHPEEFHKDFPGHKNDPTRPLWVQVLAKDHKVGFPSELAIRDVLRESGMVKDRDYKWNKSEKFIEFANGTLLQFKTAQDPESLRGAGLDILWIDESAAIPGHDAWDVIRPSLVDQPGMLVTTTTPKGKNWFYEEFFVGEALDDAFQFRVEYTSIDNPHLSREFIEYERRTMHPALFKQEYLASFDAMSGLTLPGEWLRYFTIGKDETGDADSIQIPRSRDGRMVLKKYIGVDPATGEGEDDFGIVCLGLTPDRDQGFILKYFKGRIPYAEQLEMIGEWVTEFRPEYIGIESNVFQRIYAQQVSRMRGLPNVIPVFSRGKKNQRIIAMSPLFKTGKIRIHAKHVDFIDQWVSFDGERTNNRDDLLDATEIAIGVAGVLLPTMDVPEEDWRPTVLKESEEAAAQINDARAPKPHETLGTEF
jgi:terminase large subunit-like protein